MSNIFQAWLDGQRTARGILFLLAGFTPSWSPPAAAHDLFNTCIQHSVHLAVGARHIDVILDLTFFEEWSVRERGAMDADNGGNISRSELESYQKKLAPRLARQVRLRVAGREMPLVPLYDPEVDLLANDKVGPAHHRLRLFFFVSTPDLHAGDEIVIEDRLWPEAKVLGTQQAEGRDGCKLTTEISVDADFAAACPDDVRSFKFRCLKPPTKSVPRKTSPTSSATKAAKSSASPQQPKPTASRSVL